MSSTIPVYNMVDQYNSVMRGIQDRSAGNSEMDVLLNIKKDVSNWQRTLRENDELPRNIIPYADRVGKMSARTRWPFSATISVCHRTNVRPCSSATCTRATTT